MAKQQEQRISETYEPMVVAKVRPGMRLFFAEYLAWSWKDYFGHNPHHGALHRSLSNLESPCDMK